MWRLHLHSPDHAPCAIGEIPDCIDVDGKLTRVRRLIRESILECVDV